MKPARRVRIDADRAWLRPEQFGHEPIYCDAQGGRDNDDNDVLVSGSDDEAYNSPAERCMRFEDQAHRFIEGKPMVIISASLHGPFDKASGWTNPWRSRSAFTTDGLEPKKRKRTAGESAGPEKRTRVEVPKIQPVKDKGRNETAAKRNRHPRDPDSSMAVPCSSFQYLDDEVATRVMDWAESILVESQGDTQIPENGRGEQTPTPRRQNPERPALSSPLVNMDNERRELIPSQGASNIASGSPTLRSIQVPCEHPESSQLGRPPAEPSAQRLPSVPRGEYHTKPDATGGTPRESDIVNLLPLDVVDLSPRAVKAYEEHTLRLASGNKTPMPEKDTRAEMTPAAAMAAIASPARQVGDINYHTCSDRSFRFRSKKPLRKKSTRQSKSIVANTDPPNTWHKVSGDLAKGGLDDTVPSTSMQVDGRTSEPVMSSNNPGLVDVREPEGPQHPAAPVGGGSEHGQTPDVKNNEPLDVKQPEVVQRDAASVIDCRHTPIDMSILQPDTITDIPKLGGPEPDETDESDTSTISSAQSHKIAALKPPSKSGASIMMSLGTFSFEKQQSQTLLADFPRMPRKLLWPRSQRQAEDDDTPSDPISLPPFEWAGPRSNSSGIPVPPKPEQSHFEESENTAAETPLFNTNNCSNTLIVPPEESAVTSQKDNELLLEEDRLGELDDPVVELGSPAEPGGHHSGNPSPRLELGSPIKPVGHAFEGGCSVTTSDDSSEHRQIPWSKDAAAELRLAEEATSIAPEGDAPMIEYDEPSELQSPWAGNAKIPPLAVGTTEQATTPDTKPPKLSFITSQALQNLDEQSPWARGDSQVTAVVQPRLFNPITSPDISPHLPEAMDLGFPSPRPLPDEDTEMANSPCLPSTPSRYNSSLPTPEFTLSIKSFREFMTPSPIRRTPLGPADSNGRLPSTQLLADAAASNPWIRPSSKKRMRKKAKKAKRVSWALLPDGEPAQSQTSAEFPACPSSSNRFRPASPPPTSLLAPDELPAENQKFGKHFAAVVANRRRHSGLARRRSSGGVGTPLARLPRRGVALLPSASQQVCESPAADAMAEAFIQADAGVRAYSEGLEEARGELASEGVEVLGYLEGVEEEMGEELSEPEDESQRTVDDVTEVLENLDDFLERWDVDAELAKARAESERKEKERKERNGGAIAEVAGLMDVGVWD